jgi:hypothetical protein
MEREIMPDHGAEVFYRYLIPENTFEESGKPRESPKLRGSPNKKAALDLYDVSKGVSTGGGARNFFNDEVGMIVRSERTILRKCF